MLNEVKRHLKRIAKGSVVGLDIETITYKFNGWSLVEAPTPSAVKPSNEMWVIPFITDIVDQTKNKWRISPFEIGLYNPVTKEGITIYINPYYWNNLTRKEASMFFYPEDKYREGKGYVLTMPEVREVFKGVQLNTVYGHNLIRFDLFHLASWGIGFKTRKVVDTYLEIGNALPLKYYMTLRKWHESRMNELNELRKETERKLTKHETNYYYKFFTQKGNLRMTAEAVYCYLSANPDFIEAHTAEQDCIIEYEIYKFIRKRQKTGHRTGGNWLTILQDFFNKFKATTHISEQLHKMEKRIQKFQENTSYTDKLLACFIAKG